MMVGIQTAKVTRTGRREPVARRRAVVIKGLLAVIVIGVLVLGALGGGGLLWLARTDTVSVLRTVPLHATYPAQEVAVDGRAGRAVFTSNGPHPRISILDTRTGDIVQVVAIPGYFYGAMAASPATGHTFVLSGAANTSPRPSAVSLLDTRRGAILGAIPVPANARAIAVDDRDGHACVASVGATTRDFLATQAGVV